MRYHKGYPEKYWPFLYSFDAFLIIVSVGYILSLIVEFGLPLSTFYKTLLGYFNLIIVAISLLELLIKFVLSSAKSSFIKDEYIDFIFTNILFFTILYSGYVHFYKLELPFQAVHWIRPTENHWIFFKIVLIFNVLLQFKEFNRIVAGLKIQPAHLLVWGFFILIASGTLFLLLPFSALHKISPVDALFMATSATCVTGLAPLQPSTDFTFVGQLILLLLIQVGGLGIMTIGAFIAMILRGGFGIEGRKIMSESIELRAQHQLYALLKQIMKFTFLTEILGAAILSWRFYPLFHDTPKAIYYGIFHSISAFCNAGFGLYPASLIPFQKDPILLITISLLIIFGGIGFLVVSDLSHYFSFRKKNAPHHRLTTHSKIVLWITLFLISGGTLLIYFTERNHQLSGISIPMQILNAYFQAVTPRTAGFNTIDIGLLNSATLLTLMSLMVVGGGSGSTAGGIKVNTFGILLSLIQTTVKGKEKVVLFERAIPSATVNKAIAVTFFSMLITVISAFLILAHDPFPFTQVIFETISAFNTVGLSMGITPQLSDFAKIILTLLMFIGRIGPITFVIALTLREKEEEYIDFPEENILVG